MRNRLIKIIRLRNIGLIIVDWLRRMPAGRYLRCSARYSKAGISLILVVAIIWQDVAWAIPTGKIAPPGCGRYSLRALAYMDRKEPINAYAYAELVKETDMRRIFYYINLSFLSACWAGLWFSRNPIPFYIPLGSSLAGIGFTALAVINDIIYGRLAKVIYKKKIEELNIGAIRGAGGLENYVHILLRDINYLNTVTRLMPHRVRPVSEFEVLAHPGRYRNTFFVPLYELLFTRLSEDFDGSEEFVRYCRRLMMVWGARELQWEMARKGQKTKALRLFSKMKWKRNAEGGTLEFYRLLLSYVTSNPLYLDHIAKEFEQPPKQLAGLSEEALPRYRESKMAELEALGWGPLVCRTQETSPYTVKINICPNGLLDVNKWAYFHVLVEPNRVFILYGLNGDGAGAILINKRIDGSTTTEEIDRYFKEFIGQEEIKSAVAAWRRREPDAALTQVLRAQAFRQRQEVHRGRLAEKRSAAFFPQLIRDEIDIIKNGLRNIGAAFRSVADRDKLLKAAPWVVLGAVLLTAAIAVLSGPILRATKTYPFLTAMITSAVLAGFLAELISQKLVPQKPGSPPQWYRLAYKVLMFFGTAPVLVLFYLFVDTYIPAEGAYPLLKIAVDQFVYTPFVGFTMYYTLLNLFEYLYKRLIYKDTTETFAEQLPFSAKWKRQVYEGTLRAWPIWIPAHVPNYFLLDNISRVIFANAVNLVFMTIIAVLDKSRTGVRKQPSEPETPQRPQIVNPLNQAQAGAIPETASDRDYRHPGRVCAETATARLAASASILRQKAFVQRRNVSQGSARRIIVPRLEGEGFVRDFKFVETLSGGLGERTVMKFRYVGRSRVLSNGVRLKKGSFYVVKAEVNEESAKEFLVRQATVLSRINPDNINDTLPKLIGLVDFGNVGYRIFRRRPFCLWGNGIVLEFINGKTVGDYTKKVLRRRPSVAKELIFISLALRILQAYKITYADKGYVHGDIDPTDIMAVEEDGEIIRVVFHDNDTPTKLNSKAKVGEARKRASKRQGKFVSRDRVKRLESERTPAIKYCLPRDDVYALCATLIDTARNTCSRGERPRGRMKQLERVLIKYRRLAEQRCPIDEPLLDNLIAEVRDFTGQQKADGTIPPTRKLELPKRRILQSCV